MGVSTVHYLMLAANYQKEDFKNEEDFYNLCDLHYDNPYKENFNKDKIYIISDGMSSQYVFVGYIIEKSLDGFKPISLFDMSADIALSVDKIQELDSFYRDNFLPLNIVSIYVFTHWH